MAGLGWRSSAVGLEPALVSVRWCALGRARWRARGRRARECGARRLWRGCDGDGNGVARGAPAGLLPEVKYAAAPGVRPRRERGRETSAPRNLGPAKVE